MDAEKLVQLRDMCRRMAGCKPSNVRPEVKPKTKPKEEGYGGWEYPGHPPGCRCYPLCDPSR